MVKKYIAGLGVLSLVMVLAACEPAPEAEVQDFADDPLGVEEPMDDFSDDDFLMVDEDDLMGVDEGLEDMDPVEDEDYDDMDVEL